MAAETEQGGPGSEAPGSSEVELEDRAGLPAPARTPRGCGLRLDCSGMRCPQPVLRLAAETAETTAGTIVDIVGDCPTFEKDVRVFCERRRKTILAVRSDGATKCIRIQY